MRQLLTLIVLFASMAPAATVRAGQPYLVSQGDSGNIWRLEDLNGDGDAMDASEVSLWADGSDVFAGMQMVGSAIYACEPPALSGNGRVVRFVDLNGDGDALDLGERVTWADGFDQPIDIARDEDGSFYVTDSLADVVWRLTDANDDGDALDIGERIPFADTIGVPAMLLPWKSGMLVSAYDAEEVVLLEDIDGDGDALEVGERSTILSAVAGPTGLHGDGSGGLYVTSINGDTIYHASDNNADGDFFDVAEVLSYADGVFGSIGGPWNMTDYATGGILVADYAGGKVSLVRDLNGDGDALDLGEVVLFADGIAAPVDIVALAAALPGDYNNDGTVDAADYVVWRKADGAPQGYDDWRAHFGQSIGGGSNSQAAVPEPLSLVLAMLAISLLLTAARPIGRGRPTEARLPG